MLFRSGAILPLVIAAAIVLDSGWPVLFVQERAGKDRRAFRLYKFRTLRRDYDPRLGQEFMQAFVRGQNGKRNGRQLYKPIERSEITRVGGFLRRTSLDELPQIVNVLRGEMSLVGPRPNVPWEVAAYRDWHNERLRVLPGITGLAQISGRSGITFDEIARQDIDYVRRRSLKLDTLILWWTVRSVLLGGGAG